MTLPIQPLCGDNASKLPLRGGGGVPGRRKHCLSAAWADPPTISSSANLNINNKKERRRAICSWSVGYGTLTEFEELSSLQQIKKDQTYKGKVAENNTLLDLRGRRLVNSIALPHASPPTSRRPRSKVDFLAMPGIKTIVKRRRNSGADTQIPLVNNSKSGDNSRGTTITTTATITTGTISATTTTFPTASKTTSTKKKLYSVQSTSSLANLRKCEAVTVLRSSSSTSSVEPLQAINRLRVPSSPNGSTSRLCSRCSSLLTLASASRYSLNSSLGGFIPVNEDTTPPLLCKLCLAEVPLKDACRIEQCNCCFCIECMKAYVEFEIAEGAYDISCPDAQCLSQGILQQDEIKRLAGDDLLEKHNKYRLNREIELDKSRTWCPRAGCETVCVLCPSQRCQPQNVHCPTCTIDFCSNCKSEWHEGISCEENTKRLAKEGKTDDIGIPFDSDLIKCCPMCNVPIEKDEGCAQMMCKRCKHVFCWYCLASLDDDFLLRHYDKGPCKNKLGHSRASVIWHRTQVIGIFAGIGILLLVASPLLLLAAPCIVCCKCRVCNAGTTKLDSDDDEEDLPINQQP